MDCGIVVCTACDDAQAVAPGYYDMVEQSMDYETMTNRLLAPERNGGKYTGLQDMLVRRLRSLLAYGLAGGGRTQEVVCVRWRGGKRSGYPGCMRPPRPSKTCSPLAHLLARRSLVPQADLHLIFFNATLYNEVHAVVSVEAMRLQALVAEAAEEAVVQAGGRKRRMTAK